MSNPLYTTEILAKVFKYLDIQDLTVVSFVNKTWRLEARRIIYQNRSDIIYSFFKRYLNNLRLNRYDLSRGLLAFIPFQSFESLKVFRYAFGLDIKTELLSIRRQIRNEHRRLKIMCKKLDKEAIEKAKVMESCILYSKEYYQKRAIADTAFKEFLIAQDHRFEIYRDFVNFEYFLMRFGDRYLLTDEEIDIIIDKLQPLHDLEIQRRWGCSVNSILEYWGDEDPDMV
jgi:hypothetical protein